MNTRLFAVALSITVALSLSACVPSGPRVASTPNATPSAASPAPYTPTATPNEIVTEAPDAGLPDSYNVWPLDSSVGYRFKTIGVKCSYYDHCVNVMVYAVEGCSSLYVEADVLDKSGTAIDYANDTLGSLSAGQKGRLVLGSDDPDAARFQLSEIDCI